MAIDEAAVKEGARDSLFDVQASKVMAASETAEPKPPEPRKALTYNAQRNGEKSQDTAEAPGLYPSRVKGEHRSYLQQAESIRMVVKRFTLEMM